MPTAVIIPTIGRLSSLRRAIASVEDQTLCPDKLIIIFEKNDVQTKNFLQSYSGVLSLTYLENTHLRNLSGALNCGIQRLISLGWNPEETYCAFLDDDDTWEPEYLETCLASAQSKSADWVISGLIRHEGSMSDGQPLTIPDLVSPNNFFTGNPHIQGSNLFVRLSTLLMAGGFGEHLNSTTDRDICIRLLDLPAIRIVTVPHYLVHHWALPDPRRLSYPGSPKKIQGLQAFYQKYSARMTTQEQMLFKERASSLFSCMDISTCPEKCRDSTKSNPPTPELVVEMPFVVGFTATHVSSAVHLLDDLAELFSGTDLLREVIICDNTSPGPDQKRLLSLNNYRGLSVTIHTREEIKVACGDGCFGSYLVCPENQKGISAGRTVLHHYLYNAMQRYPGSVAWILDDDVRLEYLSVENKRVPLHLSDILSTVCRLKSEGISIAIGKVTGDAPVPFQSTLRVQLLDLAAEFQRRGNKGKANHEIDLKEFSKEFPEYYYDCSSTHWDHLETPFTALLSGYSGDELFSRILDLKHGCNISRAVAIAHEDQAPLEVTPGVLPRGGNTLVLNPNCLSDFPNISPQINGVNLRRGDTFWCIENLRIGAKKISSFPHAVLQERVFDPTIPPDYQGMFADACGSAFIRAMDAYYVSEIVRTSSLPRRISLDLPQIVTNSISKRFGDLAVSRFQTILVNTYRICGLLDILIAEVQKPRYASCNHLTEVLDYFIQLKQHCNPNHVRDFLCPDVISEAGVVQMEKFLLQFKDVVTGYRQSLSRNVPGDMVPYALRKIQEILTSRGVKISSLEYVGAGHEGIVFRDNDRVYKYFYHGSMNFEDGRLAFLCDHVMKKQHLTHFPNFIDIIQDRGELIFVLSYEGNQSYAGGYLDSILDLLREVKENHFVCTNVKPTNMVVRNGKVIFVDIGSSYIPYSPKEYEIMCRRAYLSYKWHFLCKQKLDALLEKSIYTTDFPEMYGYEYFSASLNQTTKLEMLNERVIDIVAADHPQRILDFGCGRGSITRCLHEKGFEIIGYDPDMEVISKNVRENPDIRYVGYADILKFIDRGEVFDSVICSLVLCIIPDDEIRQVLGDMRKLIDSSGYLTVVICNPFSTFVQASNSHIKHDLPVDTEYMSRFSYRKQMYETGNQKDEYHRTYSWYKHLFYQELFDIVSVEEISSVDCVQLAPSSDFLIIRLKPIPVPKDANVSLIIRASPREWETIDMQIHHIVRQLEGPQHFLEKIVVTDTGGKESARVYSDERYDEFLQKLRDMEKQKIIDKILIFPDDPAIIRSTNKKWFNLNSIADRAENLQPTPMFLYGVEHCQGDYILSMDSDAIIVRHDRSHDYLGEMVSVLEEDARAVTVSFNIAKHNDEPYMYTDKDNVPCKCEVRASLLHKKRLLGLLPLYNSLIVRNSKEYLELPWHRSLYRKILEYPSHIHAYRGGGCRTFYVHIQNTVKSDVNLWYNILQQAESGIVPQSQYGNVELCFPPEEWLGNMDYPYIFLIRGRNVSVSKFRRCLSSVKKQDVKRTGLLFVDAGSDTAVPEYLKEIIVPEYGDQAVVYYNFRGHVLTSMENQYVSITKICKNLESVVITLDMDDALLGSDIIEVLDTEYQHGADLTCGSMLRSDKYCHYPADFSNPRKKRGGNVWQHLRSFKVGLFEMVPQSYFKIDGKWIDYAEDWAFMVPMVELAVNPVYIQKKCYYYEPTGAKCASSRACREKIIEKIITKPSLISNKRYP